MGRLRPWQWPLPAGCGMAFAKDGYDTIPIGGLDATNEKSPASIGWGAGESLNGAAGPPLHWACCWCPLWSLRRMGSTARQKVSKPGLEAALMGPYHPRGFYTTKAQLEVEGPASDGAAGRRSPVEASGSRALQE
jgi:hypothetical protein